MIMAKRKSDSDEFLVPSDILEASWPKGKVRIMSGDRSVPDHHGTKTSKDKSYFDGVHIDARVIHCAVHPVRIVIAHGQQT